ncbi:MAG: lysophospholipase L1-like esterase [Sulfitobacter sp.]|jgi:lysophospholipase L1-like esterase
MIISEILLRVYAGYATSETMQPGLVQRDPNLGWKLATNWKGDHKHHDYQVRYATNIKGERDAPSRTYESGAPKVLMVGDSFTFGLGVNDEETFSYLLQQKTSQHQVINAGVPGYSPEQIALRAIHLARLYQPEVIGFVLYLGNDLIDIGHEFAVQAPGGKPYMVIDETTHGRIVNMPVVRSRKPTELANISLGDRILKQSSASVKGPRILDLIWTEWGALAEIDTGKLDLSVRLLAETLAYLETNTTSRLVVVVLPGAGALNSDSGVTAQYQLSARTRVLGMLAQKNLEYIDLYTDLNQEYEGRLFHPNDGHLTLKGHEIVATSLAEYLLRRR